MDSFKDLIGIFNESAEISSSSKKAQESKDRQVKIILLNNLQGN